MTKRVCSFCGEEPFGEVIFVSEDDKTRICAPCVRGLAVKLDSIYTNHAPTGGEVRH